MCDSGFVANGVASGATGVSYHRLGDQDDTTEIVNLGSTSGCQRRLTTLSSNVNSYRLLEFILTNVVASILTIFLVLLLSVGLGVYAVLGVQPSPSIDVTIKAFSIPNHEATQRKEALDVAYQEYQRYVSQGGIKRRSVAVEFPYLTGIDEFPDSGDLPLSSRQRRAVPSPTMPSQWSRKQRILLLYLAIGKGVNNIFTRERIQMIHDFENELMNLDGFSDFCYLSDGRNCAPVNSLVPRFFRPSGIFADQMVDDLDAAVREALSTPTGFLFTDGHVNRTYFNSTFLRSEISFGVPLQGYLVPGDRREEQDAKFKKFLAKLIEFFSESSTESVRILYGGNEVFDYQVYSAFWNDMKLAVFSLAAIVFLMFVLTSFSIWFTICGLVTIALSFPLAFFFYRVVFNIVALGILNGASVFVVIGIGVDDIFVFINTFRQAHSIRSFPDRMLHTLHAAGKATFFTSFTTAAAFAANILSSIPAVHDFGLFMTLIVSFCWILVVLLMPPVINLWFRWFAYCESASCHCCLRSCKSWNKPKLPSDVAHFFQRENDEGDVPEGDVQMLLADEESTTESVSPGRLGNPASRAPGAHSTPSLQLMEETDDEALLEDSDGNVGLQNGNLSEQPVRVDSDGDDPLLVLEAEMGSSGAGSLRDSAADWNEGCTLNIYLQSFMYHYVAVPVVRVRWFIVAIFGAVLIISVACMTQLRPATKPPQLFRPDTNLQMLLDLMVNYSSQNIPWDLANNFNANPSSTQSHYYTNPRPTFSSSFVPSRSTTSYHVTTTSTSSTTGLSSSMEWSRSVPYSSTPYSGTASSTSVAPSTSSRLRFSTSSTRSSPSSTSRFPGTISRVPSVPSTPVPTANVPEHIKLEKGVTVNIVFGIKGVDRSNVSSAHVVTEKGTPVYDDAFYRAFDIQNLNRTALTDLCRLCNLISNNSRLVVPNSGQCLPQLPSLIDPGQLYALLSTIDECHKMPRTYLSDGVWYQSQARAGLYGRRNLKWIVFSFQSTTYKGMSSFTAYEKYQQWQSFIDGLRSSLPSDSPLRTIYQTSDFWNQVIMEVVAVTSAVYGLVLSMLICIVAVAIFTGHLALVGITISTMIGMIFLVVAIFYWAGWELGAIEAISLSILVGSSVDYCVHVVEGFLLAGKNPPARLTQGKPADLRRWRAHVAVTHIGASVVSSAMTTIAAALPLTQTILQPFARFGEIVAINAAVSVVYSLTACVAFLALFSPPTFVSNVRSSAITAVVAATMIGVATLVMYGVTQIGGVHIPGPSGNDLFARNSQ